MIRKFCDRCEKEAPRLYAVYTEIEKLGDCLASRQINRKAAELTKEICTECHLVWETVIDNAIKAAEEKFWSKPNVTA